MKILFICLLMIGEGSVFINKAYSFEIPDLPSKIDILGPEYYKNIDSQVIYSTTQPYLIAISQLCQYESLKEKLIHLEKIRTKLRKIIHNFLKNSNIKTEDHIFLLELQNNIAKLGLFFPNQNLTVQFINQNNINLGEYFLTRYRFRHQLSPVSGNITSNFRHSWAKTIYQGLKCIAPLQTSKL